MNFEPFSYRRAWAEISGGEQLPEVVLPITYGMVAGHPAGTRDWFPGHHNPEYARAQGQENIYANTMFFQGFLERVVLEWAGPQWFVRSRTLRMFYSVYPGDTLISTASVVEKTAQDDLQLVQLDVSARTRRPEPAIVAKIQIATINRTPAADRTAAAS